MDKYFLNLPLLLVAYWNSCKKLQVSNTEIWSFIYCTAFQVSIEYTEKDGEVVPNFLFFISIFFWLDQIPAWQSYTQSHPYLLYPEYAVA